MIGVGAWVGRDSSFLTMLAAVVVAVTFQAVRNRLTRFADRLVYGKRATPYEVLSEFSERVGGAYADEDVLPRMVRVLGEGVGAERADVWLAVGDELRDVATWPEGQEPRAPIAFDDDALPAIGADAHAFPVRHAGELLGVLAVRKPRERSALAGRREAGRRPRRAGGLGAPERPPHRGAPGASRRPARRPEAAGRRPG